MKRAALWACIVTVICSVTLAWLARFGVIPSGREEEWGKVIAPVVIAVFLGVWFNGRIKH
jgi:hypothetical protein